MHEYLTKAFNNNKILTQEHIDTWKANRNMRDFGRIKDPAEKAAVRQKIQLLYRMYVYQPALKALKAKQKQKGEVKRTIVK